METSESTKEIYAALSKFVGEVHNPINTAINPFLKNKYAPLSEVINTIRPLLSKNGLFFIQDCKGNGEEITIKTIITHSSGEFIKSSELSIKPEKNTAQALGAVITYLRRYQLSSILGLSSEDDIDGNESENGNKEKNENKNIKKVNESQIGRLMTIAKNNGWESKEVKEMYCKNYNIKSGLEMTIEQYDKTVEYYEKNKKGGQ